MKQKTLEKIAKALVFVGVVLIVNSVLPAPFFWLMLSKLGDATGKWIWDLGHRDMIIASLQVFCIGSIFVFFGILAWKKAGNDAIWFRNRTGHH